MKKTAMKAKMTLEQKRKRANERQKAFARANPEYAVNQKLMKNYSITLNQYNMLHEAQDGVCYICERECPTNKRLAVDHSWKTGLVRGLLCINCNKGLGNFKDNKELLYKAIQYLIEADKTEEYVSHAFNQKPKQDGVQEKCGDRNES